MAKISLSWYNLKPNINVDGDFEGFDSYIKRIRMLEEFSHIPEIIFKQWIHGLHNDANTLNNYAWMDYENITFEAEEWKVEDFLDINVANKCNIYFTAKKNRDFSELIECSNKADWYSSWKENGTWLTPPIILDVSSINVEIPEWSDIKAPFQLVEGHTRLGCLLSLIKKNKEKKTKLALTHTVYVMNVDSKESLKSELKKEGEIKPPTNEELKEARAKLDSLTDEERKFQDQLGIDF